MSQLSWLGMNETLTQDRDIWANTPENHELELSAPAEVTTPPYYRPLPSLA